MSMTTSYDRRTASTERTASDNVYAEVSIREGLIFVWAELAGPSDEGEPPLKYLQTLENSVNRAMEKIGLLQASIYGFPGFKEKKTVIEPYRGSMRISKRMNADLKGSGQYGLVMNACKAAGIYAVRR